MSVTQSPSKDMERRFVYLPSQALPSQAKRSQDDVSEHDSHNGRQPLQELAGNVNKNGGANIYNATTTPQALNAPDEEIARINTHILGHTECERVRALERLGPYHPPPVLPTQALGQYGHMPPAYTRQHDQHRLQQQQQRHTTLDDSLNPLWQSPQFQTYRARQLEKEGKDDQKWPDILEFSFLDGETPLCGGHAGTAHSTLACLLAHHGLLLTRISALILIPHLERKKFTIKTKPLGRNELIGMYIWLAYCKTLPPGVEPDHNMWRKRKQISSHIQVLKGLFQFGPCCKFGPHAFRIGSCLTNPCRLNLLPTQTEREQE